MIGGSPVHQFGFWNGEVDFPGVCNCPYGAEGSLERTDLVRYEREEVVGAKSSTYERTKP